MTFTHTLHTRHYVFVGVCVCVCVLMHLLCHANVLVLNTQMNAPLQQSFMNMQLPVTFVLQVENTGKKRRMERLAKTHNI